MKAVVDIGSNSVKYSLAKILRGVPTGVQSRSWVTRLGQALDQNKLLSAASLHATEKAFQEMAQDFRAHSLTNLRVVATAAVREAKNPELVQKLVEKIFQVPLEILSGRDEAYYSFRGALGAAQAIPRHETAIVMDVGGASTEVGVIHPHFQAESFFAGARRCSEGLGFRTDALDDEEWKKAQENISQFFPPEKWAALLKNIESSAPARPLIAVGGTLVMAAKICAATPPTEFGIHATRNNFVALNDRLRRLSEKDRAQVPGIAADRADVVCAGILILTYLMEKLGKDEVFVTTWGLRHGLLLAADDH